MLSALCCCCQAMHEFAHLCQEKDASVVLSVLPLWPKVYAKLSIVSETAACTSKAHRRC